MIIRSEYEQWQLINWTTRKKLWCLSVSAGTDYNGKRITFKKTIRANTKAEAEIELARYIAEIASPDYKLPDNITLNEFVQIWLRDHAERDLQPKTLVGYKSILNRRILPEFGARPMAEIRPIEINRFYNATKYEEGSRVALVAP